MFELGTQSQVRQIKKLAMRILFFILSVIVTIIFFMSILEFSRYIYHVANKDDVKITSTSLDDVIPQVKPEIADSILPHQVDDQTGYHNIDVDYRKEKSEPLFFKSSKISQRFNADEIVISELDIPSFDIEPIKSPFVSIDIPKISRRKKNLIEILSPSELIDIPKMPAEPVEKNRILMGVNIDSLRGSTVYAGASHKKHYGFLESNGDFEIGTYYSKDYNYVALKRFNRGFRIVGNHDFLIYDKFELRASYQTSGSDHFISPKLKYNFSDSDFLTVGHNHIQFHHSDFDKGYGFTVGHSTYSDGGERIGGFHASLWRKTREDFAFYAGVSEEYNSLQIGISLWN